MISEKLMSELNEQIKYEFFSANFYLAMAAYCDNEDLPGFANFFKVQAQEENFHAMKFYDYIVERGGRVTIPPLDGPSNDFESILDVFEKGLEHENFVTKRIYGLMDLANDEREHATISYLKWFIDEQVEEEATFSGLVKKLKRIEENSNAMYMLDAELAKRVFTPPTNA